jgi:hypothetical protein
MEARGDLCEIPWSRNLDATPNIGVPQYTGVVVVVLVVETPLRTIAHRDRRLTEKTRRRVERKCHRSYW